MTTTPDIEVIRKRADSVAARLEGMSNCSADSRPTDEIAALIRALLSHIAALEAGRETELLEMIAWLGDEGFFLLTGPDSNETILEAYLAQKEKK